MKSEEIKRLGISSSQKYYNYLSENGQGVVIINIIDKSRRGEIFKFSLNRKIHNIEMIEFEISGEQIDSDRIKIIEYDRDNNTLTVKPIKNLQEQFRKLHNDEIRIISDLKFLIKRVEDWYEKHGDEIKIPSPGVSLHINTPTNEDFFPEMMPSPDQRLGIEAIFNSPLNYVWGAPGTGKTQLVLAYSLIQYIRSGKKVAIFAATNNALEQILYGVLKMTKEAGIEDSKILRLGTPSSKFAQEHPNSCESIGVQRRISELNNQIEIIKKGIEHKELFEALKIIKDKSQEIFSQFEEVYIQKEKIRLGMKSIKENILHSQYVLDKLQLQVLELEENIKQKEKIKAAFSYRLKKLFTKNINLEIELREERIRLYEIKNESNIKEDEVSILRRQYKELEIEHNDSSESVKLIEDIQSLCANNEQIEEIVSSITLQNYQSIQNNLNAYVQEYNEMLITEKYIRLTEQELLKKLKNLESKKNNLESDSTESVEKANVIALTLDCYIGRYQDKELPAEHYFLDEAGYASLIKALTLFRRNIPITLLGDHMQLPPVCEMNDSNIEEDNQDIFMWAQSSLYAEWIFTKESQETFLDYSKRNPYVFNRTKKIDLLHTYRFGAALAHKLDEFVYQNGFVAHDQIGETGVYYVDAPHTSPQSPAIVNGHETHSPSRENQAEASKIRELVGDLDENSFAILTPYRKQATLIENELPGARRNQRIMTIHGSQGKEWDDVVLSVVDTDRMYFVNTLNRQIRGLNILNTAVSRARKRLFIVCNYNFWIRQDNQLIKGLLETATPAENIE